MARKAKKPPEDQALEEEFLRPPRDWLQYPRSKILIVAVVGVALAVLTGLLWPAGPTTKNFLPGAGHVNRFGAGAIVGATFIVIASLVYFVAKRTFWDLLQLLVVPLALAAIGFWFTQQQQEHQQELEARRAKAEQRLEDRRAEADRDLQNERAQDEALQSYLDQMGTLLLERNLRAAEEDSNVRNVARARTLTTLAALDPHRKQKVVRFLEETQLIQPSPPDGEPVISLRYAELQGVRLGHVGDLGGFHLNGIVAANADLSNVHMLNADLHGADLREADLSGADLTNADLHGARLLGANLTDTDLTDTDLSGANLKGVRKHVKDPNDKKVTYETPTNEELDKEGPTLEGATMPDGQKYEEWLKDRERRQ